MLKTPVLPTLTAAALLAATANVHAASLVPNAGYSVGEVLGDATLGAFDVYEDAGAKAYAWDSGSATLRQYNVSSGGVLADFGVPSGGYADNAFISFVRRAPDGNSVWVGFTVGGNTDDRIYEVTNLDTTPVWNQRATVAGNFDLAFSASGAPFVSANPGGFGNAINTLYYLDAANGYNAVPFAETGGFSADMAFGVAGQLIYGTNGLGANQLVSYSSGDIGAFLANPGAWTPLALEDATVLSGLGSDTSGLFADAFGNVFIALSDFSGFPFSGTLAQWNGVEGSGDQLNVLATVADSLGELDGLGELQPFGQDGILYQSVGFGQPGLNTLVPEPRTYAMIAGCLALGLVVLRRRRG